MANIYSWFKIKYIFSKTKMHMNVRKHQYVRELLINYMCTIIGWNQVLFYMSTWSLNFIGCTPLVNGSAIIKLVLIMLNDHYFIFSYFSNDYVLNVNMFALISIFIVLSHEDSNKVIVENSQRPKIDQPMILSPK